MLKEILQNNKADLNTKDIIKEKEIRNKNDIDKIIEIEKLINNKETGLFSNKNSIKGQKLIKYNSYNDKILNNNNKLSQNISNNNVNKIQELILPSNNDSNLNNMKTKLNSIDEFKNTDQQNLMNML